MIKDENKNNILLIISCSKNSSSEECLAKDMYYGTIFLKAQQLAELYSFHILIMSAKYGLITNNDMIKPYNQIKIDENTKKQINNNLNDFILKNSIKTIVIILGNDFFKVIKKELKNYSKDLNVFRLIAKSYRSYAFHISQLIRFGELYNKRIFENFKSERMMAFRNVFS